MCVWVTRTSLVHELDSLGEALLASCITNWRTKTLVDVGACRTRRSVHHFLSANNKIKETAPSDYVFKGNWADQPRPLRHNGSRRCGRRFSSLLSSVLSSLVSSLCFDAPVDGRCVSAPLLWQSKLRWDDRRRAKWFWTAQRNVLLMKIPCENVALQEINMLIHEYVTVSQDLFSIL